MFRQKHTDSIRRRLVMRLILAGIVMSGATGCVQHVSPPIEAPGPTRASSFFDSDEEALQAGVDGYQAYLATSDLITADGGQDPQRIAPYVSDELLPSFIEGYQSLQAKGLRSQGSTAYDSPRFQSWTPGANDDALVSFYICVDVSQVRIVDGAGSDVTPPERALRIPLLVTVRVVESASISVLTENEPWSGESFC